MPGETARSNNPRLDRVEDVLAIMGERLDRTGERLDRIAETQRETVETQRGTVETQRDIAARQRDTEEKLNAFITAVHDFEDAPVAGHKRLLTAQVLMQEELLKIGETQRGG